MTILEVVEKLEALKRELHGGHLSALVGRYATRIEFTIVAPNDSSMQALLPLPPGEAEWDLKQPVAGTGE
jgi:hypothetical protein